MVVDFLCYILECTVETVLVHLEFTGNAYRTGYGGGWSVWKLMGWGWKSQDLTACESCSVEIRNGTGNF